ncbi:hypothetical protein BT96DRAFT_1005037 [Gymnopus androsaceus JB14]|uniref:Uncharacterized protein n=1 Tax=Gymnopus androsaceus JB14 TaxID=1447944 RepID=A0A6A4GQ96_9AGAR|nr:hypothetical protein BT96DRAFT_1005037 [Gymnopus androsaceus JB14]
MALTQTQPAITIPMGRGGWEDQVVPALRKRLESESRTLARRISARSVSAEEEELPKSQSQSKSKLKSSNSNSSSSGLSHSTTDHVPEQNADEKWECCQCQCQCCASGKPTTEPELSVLHEQRSFVKDEQPPFNTYPSLNPADDPSRASTDSERPFEHWYRGEVSRNGGVGEYRVARKQEMLEIANYGYTTKARETTLNGVGGRRPRSGSPRF